MPYDYKAKQKNVSQLNNYMLAKTLSMFEYQGLPETIPARELEKLLQKNGYAFITKAPDGQLYAFSGGLGGETDVYGNPTKITIANTALKYNATLDLKKDGVLIYNDDMASGLLPFYEKQNTLIAENEINMVVWGFNSRTQKLISAPDDKSKESAEMYIRKIIEGDLSVIGENALFDGVKVQPANNGSGNNIQQMIEYHQYIKSCLYNEVGLPSNFNMKRERLISSEIDQAEDSLFPLVYNMMENRLQAVNQINDMFETNIIVGFGSVWALKNKKLVDGVVDNNADLPDATKPEDNNVNNGDADNADNEKQDEPGTSAKQDESGEPEKANINTESDNGNDNGGKGSASETGVNNDNNSESENDSDNNSESENDSDNNSESENDSDNGENNDEQKQRQSDNSDNNQNSGDDSESEKTIAELQAIIDSPDSTAEDKQAAQELLNELNKETE